MKKYLIILLFLLLVSFTGGCMPGEDISLGDLIRLIQHVIESDEDGNISKALEKVGSVQEPRPDVVVPEDDWVDFAAFVKLVDTGRWHFVKDGVVEVKLEYFYQGREQLQGIETDKVIGNSREDNPDCWKDWIMWVDDQGQIVKLIINDEVMDDWQYGFAKLMIASPLVSFALEDIDPEFNQEFKQVLAGQQVPEWKLHRFDQRKDQIGGKSVDVYTVGLEHWAFIGDGETLFEYGDFGWFKILLNRYAPSPHSDWETLELTFRH